MIFKKKIIDLHLGFLMIFIGTEFEGISMCDG